MSICVNKEICSGCGRCIKVCQFDAIKIENEKAVRNDNCVECGACINQCKEKAISFRSSNRLC